LLRVQWLPRFVILQTSRFRGIQPNSPRLEIEDFAPQLHTVGVATTRRGGFSAAAAAAAAVITALAARRLQQSKLRAIL